MDWVQEESGLGTLFSKNSNVISEGRQYVSLFGVVSDLRHGGWILATSILFFVFLFLLTKQLVSCGEGKRA